MKALILAACCGLHWAAVAAPPTTTPVPTAAPAKAPVAVAIPADPGLQPTRLQYCLHETQNVAKAKHKSEVSACLKRRHAAEKIIARDCKKEVNAVQAPLNHGQKAQWQRACEARLLAVNSNHLPKPPPPKPRPKKVDASPGVAPVAAPAAPTAVSY